jgi:cyclic dehypoxanthinyl futalosine synthase
MHDIKEIKEKIISGERITSHEAVTLFDMDILELAYLADLRRKMIYPEESAGFIIDRIINYTNICEAKCRFCAFHSRAGRIDPYTLSMDEILDRIGKLEETGGLQVMLQGGLHPDYDLDFYINMVSTVRERFPGIYLHSFSPSEIVHLSVMTGLSYEEIIRMLKEAGLNSIPGASDLLVDRIRRMVSPKKSTVSQWCDVMRALGKNGMGSTATMTYGMGETCTEKVEHLDVIRSIQDETGILRAFIPWSFSPKNTDMEDVIPATGTDYLKIVAIARIYLDNIRYIQAGWLTEGLKMAQIALAMGANDMGGVLMEEVVVKATGIETRTNMEELIELIKNAGKEPVLRDSEYNVLRRF